MQVVPRVLVSNKGFVLSLSTESIGLCPDVTSCHHRNLNLDKNMKWLLCF